MPSSPPFTDQKTEVEKVLATSPELHSPKVTEKKLSSCLHNINAHIVQNFVSGSP